MKKIALVMAIAAISLSQSAFGWGRVGHDTIACIAERNISPKARKIIEKYLGHSIIYYASWMDDYRNAPGYEHTTMWHGGSVDENMKSTDAVRNPKGDCVAELENAIERLKHYRELDDSTVVVNLKYVIHLVGDMHCPSHVYYPGLKVRKVKLMGRETGYHRVWDRGVIDASHLWSYSEYADQLDRLSRREIKAITTGTPTEWFEENARNCRVIYDWAHAGSDLGRPFVNEASRLVDDQLMKAGYRLAKVLDDLF